MDQVIPNGSLAHPVVGWLVFLASTRLPFSRVGDLVARSRTDGSILLIRTFTIEQSFSTVYKFRSFQSTQLSLLFKAELYSLHGRTQAARGGPSRDWLMPNISSVACVGPPLHQQYIALFELDSHHVRKERGDSAVANTLLKCTLLLVS